ncbi:transmembrane protease serine 6-like [Physella acuta]|uniref:transmembrane protease serine 6-like n=1 Tax=Physella acuta TaxID=109671 RepID=UPI0027DBFD39|nr:transmembrane protease serine 6-like [Physella acuta]
MQLLAAVGAVLAVRLVAGLAAVQEAECGIFNSLRIVGGSSSSECEYPWMVLLYDRSHNTTCGGAIIDHIHILTAAHCVAFSDDRTHQLTLTSPSDLTVHSGTSVMNMDTGLAGSVTRLVASVVTHHGYSPMAIDNDIALVTLTRPIEFDWCHKPVCLVDGSKTPQMASDCRVVGWGRNSSSGPRQNILKWVDIPVVSDDGDSGGPLVCQEFDGRFYSYGIVSSGPVECGTSYGLYTKVSRYIAWIEENQRKWTNGQP